METALIGLVGVVIGGLLTSGLQALEAWSTRRRAAPPAAEAVPAVGQQGWLNTNNKQLLVITFAGTVVANIVTVLLVGGAIATVHALQSVEPRAGRADILSIIAAVTGGAVLLYGLAALATGLAWKRKKNSPVPAVF